jgi:hypothetical protein
LDPRPTRAGEDFVARALQRSRDEFTAAHPHPFLVGPATANLLLGPTPTLRGDDPAVIAALRRQAESLTPEMPQRPHAFGDARLVLPVQKVQGSFPSMITVGRTKNNDVVLADPMISKFHAYFRLVDGAWMLADAGSVNGTRINDVTLPPKGAPQPLRVGDRIGFGDRVLVFLDSAGAWAALRQRG